MYERLMSDIRHASLLSDQVDKQELSVVLRECLKVIEAGIEGDVVEFGCYVGTTSVFLARIVQPPRQLYLYDSFEGLPPKTSKDESPAGTQFIEGELKASRKVLIANVKRAGVCMPHIKKAWFSELSAHDVPEKVSFAFLDGDYYESIADPLRLLAPRLTPGATIVVDDYANEALPGAAKAVDEWVWQKGYTIRVEASLAIIRIPL
jgi:O-methyltransferase